MNYINDIILNLNKDIILFYEWEDKDNLKYFKKIPIVRVNTKFIENLFENEIILNAKCLDEYQNKSECYNNSKNKESNYKLLIIVTDSIKCLAIVIEDNKIKYKSDILLEDEDNINEKAQNISTINIKYKVLKKTLSNNFLTREEQNIKKYLLIEFENLYHNNPNKLLYYFYEYSNKTTTNVNKAFTYLNQSLDNFNNSHIDLYKLSKSSFQNNN